MGKFKVNTAWFCLLAAILLASCEKPVNGCKDKAAKNYNSKATKDDGTCYYEGSVVFYQNADNGTVAVAINGKTGIMDKYFPLAIPGCGNEGCANFILPIGTYDYAAQSSTNIKWNGTVTITTDGCQRVLIKK